MRRLYAIIAAALLAASCATTPTPTASAVNVPRARVLGPQFLAAAPGYGQVIVKRDEGFMGVACNSRVMANGTPVADLASGEKVVFYLPPGEHMFAAIAIGPCAGGLAETRANVTQQRATMLRVGYGTQGEFFITPTAF